MGDFIFWIILIPILFYIIVGTFTKDSHPNDMHDSTQDEDYGDE